MKLLSQLRKTNPLVSFRASGAFKPIAQRTVQVTEPNMLLRKLGAIRISRQDREVV
jgi:hypothetical protein